MVGKLHVLGLITVLFIAVGCGKFRQTPCGNWPAHVRSMEGYSSSQKEAVLSVLLDLNRQNDVALILDQANGDSFPITFGILSESPQNPMRVGLATRDECGCTIQLSEKIFNPSKQLFKSVTFHELGHCAGLNHSSQTGDIMFPVAYPFHSYTAPAFDKFLDDLSMIAGVR